MKGLKQKSQSLLKRAGIYHRLKASILYDAFWHLADKNIIEARERELEFYRKLLVGLNRGDWIFDIGANDGYKTEMFRRLGARVLAVEPDALNQRILAEKFHTFRVQPDRVKIVPKAVSELAGVQTMWVDTPGSWMNTLSTKWADTLRRDEARFGSNLKFANEVTVLSTTLTDLIAEVGRPYFIKIDVEGSEVNVLKGLNEPVPFLSFEVNLPEFAEEGVECINMIAALDPSVRFNYGTDLSALALPDWLSAHEFLPVFQSCKHASLEVFCECRRLIRTISR